MIKRTAPSTIIYEASSESVVFTFGRMNPPTVGHSKLIQTVIDEAKSQGADHDIYLSQKTSGTKDPLPWEYKRKVTQAMFPGVNISGDATIRTPYQALEELGKRYNNVTIVVGADRVEKFRAGMEPYTADFGIENFKVISAGERDPDADGVAGMSASKARQLAADGNEEEFYLAMSNNLSNEIKHDVYIKLRQSLGLEEDADNKEADKYRNMGLRGHFAYSGWG